MSRYIYNDATATRETDRALLVRLANGTDHWIPKSQIHDDSEVYQDGHVGCLVVKGWFAEKEGFANEADDEQEGD